MFYEDDTHWRLDKNNTVAVGAVRVLLDDEIRASFIATLVFYATNLSGGYTKLISETILHMLRATGASKFSESTLISYRALLNSGTEWQLGIARTFLKKWYELGYPGISESIVELLYSWTIKGAIKGDLIKRLDPHYGPLSDLELQGFNEGVTQAYEKNKISITDLALALIISNTGRRPIQISHLKIKDVLTGKNRKGEPCYLVNIPRAKQRGEVFRESFKQFAITHELWVILNAQVSLVKRKFEKRFGIELGEADQSELPLFPDWDAFPTVTFQDFRTLLGSDRLHIRSAVITEVLQHCAESARIHSERTGSLLNANSYRFRYTTGTRAAREGFGVMVIAELLDHSDNQNAGVYIENIPEHVARLDEAVGHQLAPYAQAFAGVLVDSEETARRGKNINSRIKSSKGGIGTCGNYGFCGANVPIPCYTCIHFQPWLNGPHEAIYAELISERDRLLKVTGDLQISAVNDRSILAVANVIQLCAKRREELENG
jgi:integrase